MHAVLSMAHARNCTNEMDQNLLQSSDKFQSKLCCCCTCGCADPKAAPSLEVTVTARVPSQLFGEAV